MAVVAVAVVEEGTKTGCQNSACGQCNSVEDRPKVRKKGDL